MPPWTEEEREQRLDEVLASYLQALKDGSAPGRQELLDSHPELAGDLAAFFADQDRFDRLAAPLRSMMPAASPQLNQLRKFGDYEVLEEIARGGMGVVFKARQKSLGRIVALKMLLAGPWASPADLRRFRTEAESAAQLDHPNIVPIYEVGTHDNHPYLSMKLVEGGSLAHHLACAVRQPSDRESAELLATVADALHYAHQHGILHRDLKPANVLLQKKATTNHTNGTNKKTAEMLEMATEDSWFDYTPLVTDFGLAKLGPRSSRLDTSASNSDFSAAATLPFSGAVTHTGAILGTPGYMAPEQASGSPSDVTVAADVYGLGAILYEMLTDRPPFKGDTPLDTLRQVLEQEPVRPSAYRPAIDRDLETICLKCLQKEPHKRYGSARELADDLRRFLRNEPILARPVGALGRMWRLTRRQPVVAALTLALAAVLLGGLSGVLNMWWLAERHRARAEQHAARVEQQRDALADAWRAAEDSRRKAEQHQEEAERNFHLAHQVVDDFSRRINSELADTPSLQPLRKALLQDALAYYQKFRERRGQDAGLRRELADTYLSIARITRGIGNRADARDAYEKALAIYRDLQRDDPDNVELQRKLGGILNDAATYQDRLETVAARLEEARTLYDRFLERHPQDWDLRAGRALVLGNLAWAEQQRGRLKAASDCYRQTHEAEKKLLEERPNNRFMQANLAAVLSNYAGLRAHQRGGLGDAVQLLDEAVQLRDALVQSAPRDANARADLAGVLQNYCTALRDAGRQNDAYKACQRAYKLRLELTQNYPLVRHYQAELAASHRLLGFFEDGANHLNKALEHHQKARDIQERLFAQDPGRPSLRRELSWSCFNVAAIQGRLDDRPAELASYRRARELQEELVRLDSDNLDYRQDLVRTLNNLAWNRMAMKHPEEVPLPLREALKHARLMLRRAPGNQAYRMTLLHALATATEGELRLGHTQRAAQFILERATLLPDDAEEQFRVAHDLATTAAKVGGGKAELTPDHRAERAADLDAALAALRRATAHGFRDAARLRQSKAFDPLRDNAEFRALLRDMEKSVPPSRK